MMAWNREAVLVNGLFSPIHTAREQHRQGCFAGPRAGFTLSCSRKKDRTVRQHAQQEAGSSPVAMETRA